MENSDVSRFFYDFEDVLILFYIICFTIQCYYYLAYFLNLANYKVPAKGKNSAPLSVIIAFKNELENLKAHVPLLLNQSYEDYELVFVNDHSNDGGPEYLESLNNDKIKVLYLEQGYEGKKTAVHHGVKNSKSEYLVFTDADCYPTSDKWLQLMADQFDVDKKIVLGHGRFIKYRGLLNLIIRYEGFYVAMQYMATALKGRGYMGVGRNLAYHAILAEDVEMKSRYASIKSGDDDLFINQVTDGNNTTIQTDKRAMTLSEPKRTWSAYYHQKRRQLQAGELYKFKDRFRLLMISGSALVFNILLVVLLVHQSSTNFILFIFVLKQIITFLTFEKVSRKLGDRDILLWVPLLEPIYLIVISFMGFSTWIWKVKRWK